MLAPTLLTIFKHRLSTGARGVSAKCHPQTHISISTGPVDKLPCLSCAGDKNPCRREAYCECAGAGHKNANGAPVRDAVGDFCSHEFVLVPWPAFEVFESKPESGLTPSALPNRATVQAAATMAATLRK